MAPYTVSVLPVWPTGRGPSCSVRRRLACRARMKRGSSVAAGCPRFDTPPNTGGEKDGCSRAYHPPTGSAAGRQVDASDERHERCRWSVKQRTGRAPHGTPGRTESGAACSRHLRAALVERRSALASSSIPRQLAYSSTGGQAHTRLRSPYTSSTRRTEGQNLPSRSHSTGKAAFSREYA